MKKFVKVAHLVVLALAGSMSVAQAEEPVVATGGNNGTVTFTGTIVESPCSIKIGDENQTISLGESLGTASLKAGLTQPVNFDIDLVNCVFDSQKDMNIVFNASGDESSKYSGYLALMGAAGEMEGSYIALTDRKGTEIKLGTSATQALAVDAAGKGLANQKLSFKAWVQGDVAAAKIDVGSFSSMTSFQITYI